MESKVSTIIFGALCLALISCTPGREGRTAKTLQWYKGNTHSHTVLCGHADTSPEAVAAWYHDRGYNFLILSEHNQFIDPDSVALPANKRADFILIPGQEVTGEEAIHTTGMNVRHVVPAHLPEGFMNMDEGGRKEAKRRILQMHVDSVLRAGGAPILNHPNYVSGIHANNIMHIKGLHMFELFNGHPDVANWGNELHASTEQKWDSLLTAGMLLYGVSSDDAHIFQEWSPQKSNPGRGWVMVRSGSLTPGAITGAMEQGEFYATNGIILSGVSINDKQYRVAIDTALTFRELASPFVTGRKSPEGQEGFVIEFIGPGGQVLEQAKATQALYRLENAPAYVRCRLSYTRKNQNGEYEQFYAWTQPWFADGRDKMK